MPAPDPATSRRSPGRGAVGPLVWVTSTLTVVLAVWMALPAGATGLTDPTASARDGRPAAPGAPSASDSARTSAPPRLARQTPWQPEGATARAGEVALAQGQREAIATAHPLASAAGERMLRQGGHAIDAAIAAQMVLTLVEPQSSGIGGGGFLLHWDGEQVHAYDGRETAPRAVDDALFIGADGQPLPFGQAVASGLSVGVPGLLRMLELAHRRHGHLPWATLFEPAIDLAEQGFPVGPRLHSLLNKATHLHHDVQARNYFYDSDRQAHPVGHRLRNPALAWTLRQVARHGAQALHEGPIARAIVHKVSTHPQRPGRLGLADLASYRAVIREPLCMRWSPGAKAADAPATGDDQGPAKTSAYRVCGFPPPSSGQLAIGQILGLLQQLGPAHPADDQSPQWWHHYMEASRLAFADRARHVADPDFVAAPGGRWDSLLDADYLLARSRLIGPRAMPQAPAGQPRASPTAWGIAPAQPERGTTHLSALDAQGRAVAMTTSIESAFGAGLMSDGGSGLVGGFLLNNQLTDFSFTPRDEQGRLIANRVEAGKRPRSSMSPTLVFDESTGALAGTLGSPGGAFIIHYTAKALLGLFAWQHDPATVVAAPHAGTLGGPVLVERASFDPGLALALGARGHAVVEAELTSGIQAITIQADGWQGAADPRREGVVLGR